MLGGLAFLWARRRPKPRRSTRSRPTPCAAGACRCRTACYVALQTMISNGFGASVGLEAAYTQMGGGGGFAAGRCG